MTSDALVVFAVLTVTVLLFVSDWLRLDLVALLALLTLTLGGILTPAEALAGFSDSAVITIAALFVVGAAMLETGLAERFGRALGRVAGTERARLTAVLMLGTGLLSAFVSTTGTVALMLPVTAALARNARLSPSILLMPMSVAALLGGLLTLIATPPNIIVSEQLRASGFEPFTFFDFTPVGLAMLALGMAVLVPFGGRLLRPRAPVDRPAGMGRVAMVAGEELVRGYDIGEIFRLRVLESSPLPGKTTAQLGLRTRYQANIVAIRRRQGRQGSMVRMRRTAEEPLQVGDELDVRASAADVSRMVNEQGLEYVGSRSEPDAVLAEVLLTPRSRLIGETLADVRFRNRYSVNVLSILRQGSLVEEDLATVPLRFADTLLVAGSPERIEMLGRESGDFVIVAQARSMTSEGSLTRGELLTIGIIMGMIVLLALDIVPSVIAVLLAAVCTVLFRAMDMEGAYRSINWQSVVLIAAMLPMATALEKTGGVEFVIAQLQPISASGPHAMLAGVFVLTAMLGLFISNTATAVLIAPVAIGVAAQLGISPHPLMMTVAIAASTSFGTPVATPANLLIIGPGEYRASDFARIGLLVQLLVLGLTLLIVPVLFPF